MQTCRNGVRVVASFGQEALAEKATGGNVRNLMMRTDKLARHGIFFPDTAAGLEAFLPERRSIMNEMIRDRRSIGWNKKHPRSWHSEGVFVSAPPTFSVCSFATAR